MAPLPPRKPPAKRLYKVGFGGVGIVDTELEKKNKEEQEARDQAMAEAQAGTEVDLQLALVERAADEEQKAQWRKASQKYDEKKREETLVEKLLVLVKYTHPGAGPGRRAQIVEDILKEENRPTAWEVNHMIAVATEDVAGQMYASALTNPDGTKMSFRPTAESHRHPLYTSLDDNSNAEARESLLKGDPPGKDQEPNAMKLIAQWRNFIQANVDEIRKLYGADADLSKYGLVYMDQSMRLSEWLELLALFPADDEEITRYMIYLIFSGADKKGFTVPDHEKGKRRRVKPKNGGNPANDVGRGDPQQDSESGKGGSFVHNDKGVRTYKPAGEKRAPLKPGSLGEEPKETKLGRKMRRMGKKILAEEQLRQEVEAFKQAQAMRKTSEAPKSSEPVLNE